MTNAPKSKWDEEMQTRVYGAAPADDYNFKKDVYPNYSEEAEHARKLVEKINASGKYRMKVSRATGAEYSAEVRRAEDGERLCLVNDAREAAAICAAIVTANVTL